MVICEKTGRGETERLLQLLEDIGPMNVHELVILTARKYDRVAASLRILMNAEHHLGKRVYIQRYDPQANGKAGRRTPVYAAGNGVDAVEGRVPHKKRDAKYRERNRAVIRARAAVRRKTKPNIWKGLMT